MGRTVRTVRTAIVASTLLVAGLVWAGSSVVPPFPYDPNLVKYQIIDAVEIGTAPSYMEGANVLFNVLDPNSIRYEFKVRTINDTPLSVVALESGSNLTVTRTGKTQIASGWESTYEVTFNATQTRVYYVEIEATDLSSQEKPVILRSQLLSWIWPPNVDQKQWQAGWKQGRSQLRLANFTMADLEKWGG